ncbi:unnamed protein product [Ceutorhynchus assimilis]|uniref:glutathione transferase n=1 Tax=Ceutorhynchus assimilis TaxID=467358 RepID=A0A9N9QS46_9CUCU|nr:unnamed protein product [Ceutorhynchus assimilis]
MPVLKYYYDLLSQPSRALYIFLKLTQIPFEAKPVSLRKGEHRSDEFKEQLNRFQKVPFIHHGDFKLAESTAILGYLSREFRHLIDDHWYPENSQARAKVDEYLGWHPLNTRMKCALYFWHKWLIPIMTESEPNERKVAAQESEMVTCLDEIETLWLSQGHKYLTGDQISVADIFAACEMEQPRIAGYDVTEGRPLIKTWFERVKQDCHPFYNEAHAIVDKIASKTKAKL